jgi:aryl-alcohol dehydrogenase-like predicted oxidoreductase/predicted kinase
MRLSTDEARDEERARETIAAAAAAGMTVFDTARAYAPGPDALGHNERLLAGALRASGLNASARIVTKGGMSRTGGGWVPDGRAKAILADCQASLVALDGLSIDLYLLHAPDPRTPWRTSVRALARLVDEGLVRRVGLANAGRVQLDEALDLAPIAAVQVALNPFDDRALRGGVVERCADLGIALIAHSPLGGPRRAGGLGRHAALSQVADARGVSPAEVALSWLLDVSPSIIAIPGARRPETARSAARAATLVLERGERSLLAHAFGGTIVARRAQPRPRDDADVVLVMGIPGAGKSRLAATYVARGYVRLNRDDRGGTLRQVADALDALLASGVRRVVLDNTYLTRAARSHVLEATDRHRVRARCVWLDTPLAQAQVNLIERVLGHVGALPDPEELRRLARRDPRLLTPTSQMRARRELEPPSTDEGLAEVEHVRFVRTPPSVRGRPAVFVAAAALASAGWQDAVADADPGAPHLVFDWEPGAAADALAVPVRRLSDQASGPVEGMVCPHAAGPPTCWCRPPLPGLLLAFARAYGVDPSRSILVGVGPAHRTLAATVGARYVPV